MLKFKRGSTAAWNTKNPVLEDGQPGVENIGNGQYKIKVGTGANWKSTNYLKVPFTDVINRPTTLAGYGITDVTDLDYEEGDWSPIPSSGNMDISYARYTRIGTMVTLTLNFAMSSQIGDGTAFQIDGLPFPSSPLSTIQPISDICIFGQTALYQPDRIIKFGTAQTYIIGIVYNNTGVIGFLDGYDMDEIVPSGSKATIQCHYNILP